MSGFANSGFANLLTRCSDLQTFVNDMLSFKGDTVMEFGMTRRSL